VLDLSSTRYKECQDEAEDQWQAEETATDEGRRTRGPRVLKSSIAGHFAARKAEDGATVPDEVEYANVDGVGVHLGLTAGLFAKDGI
jgi:hypothetical protein